MTTNGHRPCPHRHRPKVALSKCQVCWGRWRARHSEADVRAALRRECEAHHYAKRTQELKRWAFWLGTLSLLELAGLWWMATHLP